MNTPPRLGLVAACMVAFASAASAAYPDRPITLVVPAPPGGGTDVFARQLADLAEAALKQKVVAENKAGGGGTLKVLWWQGPTLLNPHFAVGTKDQDGSRLFYEPLAGWNEDGEMTPILAAELPSRDNGGLAADGTTILQKYLPSSCRGVYP